MAQTNLKRSARSFMAEHAGVPYLTALKAVDEPLHELRELSRMPDRELTAIHPHFRLVGSKSIYAPAFPELRSPDSDQDYGGLIESRGLTHFGSTGDFLKEMGRRVSLLEEARVEDIWAYRELQRSGAISTGQLEPFLHHFGSKLPWGFEALLVEGHRLGIFGVSVASFLKFQEQVSFIPLTESQLSALCSGSSLGELRLPPIYIPSDGSSKWEERGELSFSKICYSHRELAGQPRLTLLLREDPMVSGFSIEDLGLSWDDFTVEAASKHRWHLALSRDMRVLSAAGNRQYEGCSDGVLEADGLVTDRERERHAPPATSLLSSTVNLSSQFRSLDGAYQLIGKVTPLDYVDRRALKPAVLRALERRGGTVTMAQIVGVLWGSSDQPCNAVGNDLYGKLYSAVSTEPSSIREIVLNLREYDSASAVYRDRMGKLIEAVFAMLGQADRAEIPEVDWGRGGIHQLASAIAPQVFRSLILAVDLDDDSTEIPSFYLKAATEKGIERDSLCELRRQIDRLNLTTEFTAATA